MSSVAQTHVKMPHGILYTYVDKHRRRERKEEKEKENKTDKIN